jgi:C-terminal processing protease CtpA/Prc
VIVGEPTLGVAFVQSTVELPDYLGAVELRTGIMKRADGRPLHREREAPDMRPVFARRPVPPVTVQSRPAQSAEPTRANDEPVRIEKIPPRVSDPAGESLTGSPAESAGGVHPDHVVPMSKPAAENKHAPDAQLAKALELLKAMLKEETHE